MTTEASPSHLSIGDVLNSLRDEFPDITISKIRFLESQGLIDPERTPSGYRKFYDADISRLRWILYQQKEHFLPLRVIKERLDRHQFDDGDLDEPSDTEEPTAVADDDAFTASPEVEVEVDDVEPAPAPEPEPTTNGADASEPARRPEAPALPLPLADEADSGDDDERPVTGARAAASGGMSLTRAELAKMAGLEVRQVAELESYGLLAPTAHTDEDVLFDEESLAVARAAAGFARHGIEARHLRMYKHLAQREADLFQQVLLPYVRQRNPQARAKAQTDLAELAKLGRALRSALLVSAVREALSD